MNVREKLFCINDGKLRAHKAHDTQLNCRVVFDVRIRAEEVFFPVCQAVAIIIHWSERIDACNDSFYVAESAGPIVIAIAIEIEREYGLQLPDVGNRMILVAV